MTRLLFAAACALAAQSLFAEPVTFNKHIAPIVYRQCAPCHRPGEAGPFSLLTYHDVKTHARQIAAVTKSRYMPPWLPAPGVLRFADERRLSDSQIRLIEQWVQDGEPEGRPQDLPPMPKFTEGWQLGEPDLVLTLPRAFTLSPSGRDVYRNFIFSTALQDTKYVRALEIRPGNKRVVHHANLLIDRTRSSRWRDGRDGEPGFGGMDLSIEANVNDPESHFLFWKPGSVLSEEPEGMAWPLEPGTDLVLNVHLQPSGKSEQIQPSLGLYFTKMPPRLRPLLVQLENDGALDIPPGATDFTVTDQFRLPVGCDLLAVYPHAHYLGREVEGIATLPDGSRETLIHIRHWDQNWQAVYRYRTPVFLPKGTTVGMRWVYDNSAQNALNPNQPPKRVVGGNESTDEMGHLWLQLLPRGPGDQRMVIQEALMRSRVRRDPDDFTAHFNLGGLLEAKGDSAGALHEFQEAVRVHPRDATALNTLGAMLQTQNQLDEAESCYRRALEIRSDYADAHYNLGVLLLSRDSLDEAILQLRSVMRLSPDDAKARKILAEALATRGHGLAGHGRTHEAVNDFREALELEPDDSDAYTNLGGALALEGQLTQARDLLQHALQLDPASAAARKNLEVVESLIREEHP